MCFKKERKRERERKRDKSFRDKKEREIMLEVMHHPQTNRNEFRGIGSEASSYTNPKTLEITQNKMWTANFFYERRCLLI